MSFAALRVGNFGLRALRRSDAALAGAPLALVGPPSLRCDKVSTPGREGCGEAGPPTGRGVVVVSSEAPGVEPGFPAEIAMARCPGVVLRARDPAAEVEAQRLLIAAAFSLAPRVEATAAGLCTVDLQGAGPARTRARAEALAAELAVAGLGARVGIARTPLLAAYASSSEAFRGSEEAVEGAASFVNAVEDERGFLAPLPLALAGPSPEHAGLLSLWGLRVFGDLTALPKDEIGKRLGAEGVALWERAAGETVRALRLVEPAKTFAAEWSYEPPVEALEPLLFRLRRFAERVALELRGAGFVAGRLALTLILEDETFYRREFRLPEPSGDADLWLRVLHAHLEGVRTAARVAGMRLCAEPERAPVKQQGLFDTALRDPHAFWENLARLAAIAGQDRVGTPEPLDTHRPDAFVLARPAEAVPAPEPSPPHPARGLTLRRFRPPRPAEVALAGGRPVRVRFAEAAKEGERVRAVRGPWRASGDWWREEAWEAETWHIELEAGGVYQLAHAGGAWRIEGILD